MTIMTTTVVYHSADMDGLFCREIAKKFLPDAELIGWNFGDPPVKTKDGPVYILDLPVDEPFGFKFGKVYPPANFDWSEIIWIDHHKSAIESHPISLRGYRIDGVAACRLAWAYFTRDMVSLSMGGYAPLPQKQDFIDRTVNEPLAVRLAGEYDIWDKRDPRSEMFQFGLRSKELSEQDWKELLDNPTYGTGLLDDLFRNGHLLQRYQQRTDASIVNHRSFIVEWEGLKFLALTTARCNSLTFAAKDVPETGHDALMGFFFNGKVWTVSLYHAKHRTDLDLSKIAVTYGGGGHPGACGMLLKTLPFVE